jgi:hypothetical protein
MLKKVGGVAAAGAATVALASGALALGGDARGAGELRDVQLETGQPFDHATAQVVATAAAGTTTVSLKVQGIDHAAAGTVFGAHVHVGPARSGTVLRPGRTTSPMARHRAGSTRSGWTSKCGPTGRRNR